MTIHTNFPTVAPTCEAEVPAAQNAQRLPALQAFLMLKPHARGVLLNTIAQQLYEEMLDIDVRKACGAACRRDREKISRRWKRLKHRADLLEHKLRIRAIPKAKARFPGRAWSAEFRKMLTRAHQRYHAQ